MSLAVFAVGILGGFRYKNGQWPFGVDLGTAATVDGGAGTGTVPVGPGGGKPVDGRTIAGFLRSVVSVNARGTRGERAGSGFIIDGQGHVVTAFHVVDGAQSCMLTVVDDDGRAHSASIVGQDPDLDTALLHVPDLAAWTTSLQFGASSQLTPGDDVYVLGSPKGVGNSVPLAATVSRMKDEKTLEKRYFDNLIQVTGVNVIEGTSGGPLIQAATGRVVGIVSASGAPAPIAWAVSADDVSGPIKQWSAKAAPASCQKPVAASTVPVVLSTVTPLTGAFSVEGNDLADGAELALRDMESALKAVGYQVTLRREDDAGAAATAGERATSVARDPKVVGVIGSLDNQVTAALAEALRSSGLPLVAPTAGAEELTARGWSHFNRLVASSRREDAAMANFAAQRLKVHNVFIIDDGTPEAAAQAQAFRAGAQVISLAISGTAQAPADMAALKQKLVDAKAESVYIAGRSQNALSVIKGLRDLGVNLPFLGGQSFYDPPRFQSFTGAGAQGVFFPRLTAEPSAPFRRHFEDVLGKPTRGYAGYGYDAASVILSALVRYGETHPAEIPSHAEMARLVRETRGHLGWSFWVTFDGAGENKTSLVYVFEWKQGFPELRDSLQ